MSNDREIFVSVDVETAGPIPGEYSVLSIGACSVDEPHRTCSTTLKPINSNADPKALEVAGLSLEDLEQTGTAPADVMHAFAIWLEEQCQNDEMLVLVGLNAPFDWSVVNYYSRRFFSRIPLDSQP